MPRPRRCWHLRAGQTQKVIPGEPRTQPAKQTNKQTETCICEIHTRGEDKARRDELKLRQARVGLLAVALAATWVLVLLLAPTLALVLCRAQNSQWKLAGNEMVEAKIHLLDKTRSRDL